MHKKQAILIQCHHKPNLVNKIIQYLPVELFDVYIHIDKKSNIEREICSGPNVFLCKKKIDVKWGRFSQVEASIALLNMVDETKYSYIHLISGADFFAKDPNTLFRFFDSSDKEFIDHCKLPEEITWAHGGIDRYLVWYPQWIIDRPTNKSLRLLRVLYRDFILRTKVFRRRKWPVDCFYGGSGWFSISGNLVAWIKEYLRTHPEYISFFRHTLCADEMFFSTLVMNSPFADHTAENNMRYIRWNDRKTGGPATLTRTDVDDIITSDRMFARKIDDIFVMDSIIDRLNSEGKKI